MATNNNAAPSKAVTAVKKEDKKPGFFDRVKKWFRDMKSELKKVIWPSKEELWKNVLVSLGMIFSSSIVIWGFDQLAQMLVRALLSLAG